jgi:hypothetical protein
VFSTGGSASEEEALFLFFFNFLRFVRPCPFRFTGMVDCCVFVGRRKNDCFVFALTGTGTGTVWVSFWYCMGLTLVFFVSAQKRALFAK